MRQVSEGVEYSQKVVDMPETHVLTARALLMLGIGYSLMSDEVRLQSHRQSYQKKAVEAFLKYDYNCLLMLFVSAVNTGWPTPPPLYSFVYSAAVFVYISK